MDETDKMPRRDPEEALSDLARFRRGCLAEPGRAGGSASLLTASERTGVGAGGTPAGAAAIQE